MWVILFQHWYRNTSCSDCADIQTQKICLPDVGCFRNKHNKISSINKADLIQSQQYWASDGCYIEISRQC